MKIQKDKIVDSIQTFSNLKTNPLDYMNETTFKRSELNLDARTANHWYEKGLFPRKYEAGSWFIFNLTEAFWVKIMMRLREFNVSLEILKKIKENLFNDPKKIYSEEQKEDIIKTIKDLGLFEENETNYLAEDKKLWNKIFKIELNDFELLIQSILLERKHFYLLLTLDGNVIIGSQEYKNNLDNEEYKKKYQDILSKSHIHLSMNEILSDLVRTLGYSICSEKIPIFTKKEKETLELIEKVTVFTLDFRKKDTHQYESILVSKNNINEIKTIIYELIIEKNYQNIVIKPLYGKLLHLELNA